MRRFELIIEDDGIGNQNIKATNDGFYTIELIGSLEIELHSLKEQAYNKTNFDRTCIMPDGKIMEIEDKKE